MGYHMGKFWNDWMKNEKVQKRHKSTYALLHVDDVFYTKDKMAICILVSILTKNVNHIGKALKGHISSYTHLDSYAPRKLKIKRA